MWIKQRSLYCGGFIISRSHTNVLELFSKGFDAFVGINFVGFICIEELNVILPT